MNKKPIIILLIIAVILGGLIYWASTLSPDKEPSQEEISEQEYFTVYNAEGSPLQKIEIKLPDSEYSFIKNEQGNYIYEQSPTASLNTPLINQLEAMLSNMVAEEEATNAAFNLSDYGFDTPKSIVKVTFADKQVTYRVGNLTHGQGYYLNMEGSDAVYVIYSNRALPLMQPVSYYRNSTLHQVDTQSLRVIEYDSPDGRVHLTKTVSESGSEEWLMVSPIEKNADSEKISSNISQKLALVMADDFVEDNAENLNQYGLDSSARRIYFEDDYGVSCTLYIGHKHSSDSSYYIRVDQNNNVVSSSASNFSFMDMNVFTFVDSLLNLEILADMSKVEFYKGDSLQTLHITRDNDSRKESENNSKYFINNVQVSDTTFKDIYMMMIGLDIQDITDEAEKSETMYKIVYYKTNGESLSIDFTKYTERYLAAFVDGIYQNIVLKDDLENIYTTLNAIK